MMFYTQLFTSKRGPLAKIWLAAHWERKITRTHVFECNLESTIKHIISPQTNIGLRTFGHLLLGVVRIYFRKAKYLLADCNDAVVKIKVAFRPGQTDMPVEGLEATLKAITLMEDFTDFDTQLPDTNAIGVVDHFSLNQCRTEDITLKEDFGNSFLTFDDFGDETQSHQGGMLDVSFLSLAQHGDAFGDEDKGIDILDFMASSSENAFLTDLFPAEPQNVMPEIAPTNINQEGRPDSPTSVPMEEDRPVLNETTPVLNETTLLVNEEEGFALEPVAVTPTLKRKKGKRRRRLVVDQAKELSNQAVREQLTDYSDLTAPLDLAPPTHQLMQWKESGGVDRLFSHLCAPVIHPHLQQLYSSDVFRGETDRVGNEDDREEMRQERHEVESDVSDLPSELSVLHETMDPERMGHNVELTPLHHHGTDNPPEDVWDEVHDESRFEVSHPELPSEDSMHVHPSGMERETPSNVTRNTQSMVDSQDDFEERRMTSRAQKLLNALKIQSSRSNTMFSLQTLCERNSRSQTSATFFCLLVLKKQQALDLHQSEPYADIIATPGLRF
ncbi:double-strand-break repair protein rad21 homolog isoform X1 [Salmo salar]|uniref:Double-strand-break repair protein rad21 homolog isoform X1 n=1 Tax=Salmo salar TaxID=8030 RepID=A0ABM3CXB4_SALSA|nr:double-strand-break repair protein rad21 homolog isoform X1 [Salmo salar]|eukprot:XP_014002119.1 PREDICTED: double-strand-break repair protein rad21 homolog isoform X1 [Salmo salar]